jgi:two-component system, LytTR family, sensor kinase
MLIYLPVMFTHKYRYYFILLLAAVTYVSTVLCEVYKYFHIDIEWYYAFGTIALVTLFIWEAARLLEPLFIKRITDNSNKVRVLIYFFLACGTIMFALTTTLVLAESMLLHQLTLSQSFIPLKLNLIYAVLINLLFHLLNAILFYFKEYKTKSLEAEELKSITAQAELQLIKSQINPHFLFNNLNVLSSLVMQHNEDANKFIEAFSQVYRYILNNQEKELVTLETELEFIKPYIFLLEKRFAVGLHITIDIPEKYNESLIIPASLQMLVENAIKHNIASRSKPLNILLHANGNHTLAVSNNLQLRDMVENSTEIGLKNIIKRYRLVSGKEVLVEKNTESFKVTLPLLVD